jgi:hypothetical protein
VLRILHQVSGQMPASQRVSESSSHRASRLEARGSRLEAEAHGTLRQFLLRAASSEELNLKHLQLATAGVLAVLYVYCILYVY